MATRPPQSILITGCSSGIGHACAHGLAGRGWQVVASARRAEDVERLRSEGHAAVQLDLDDPRSIASGLTEALRLTGGRLDALFNNGAYGQPGAVEDLSREAYRRAEERLTKEGPGPGPATTSRFPPTSSARCAGSCRAEFWTGPSPVCPGAVPDSRDPAPWGRIKAETSGSGQRASCLSGEATPVESGPP